jgi:hypothetical protein
MKIVTAIIVLIAIFSFSCSKTVVHTRQVQVPYTESVQVPYTETKTIRNYSKIPPVFPLPNNRPMNLAILPFTSETGKVNDGLGVAEEIELAMQKHINSNKTYKIFNRTQLNNVLTEQEISALSNSSIQKTRRLLNVEGLITGHVRYSSSDSLSLILKAIDTSNAQTLFTERFEGKYQQTIQDVVGVFYEQQVPAGFIEVAEKKTRTEEVNKYRTEEQSYSESEFDSGSTLSLFILIGLILLSAYAN